MMINSVALNAAIFHTRFKTIKMLQQMEDIVRILMFSNKSVESAVG